MQPFNHEVNIAGVKLLHSSRLYRVLLGDIFQLAHRAPTMIILLYKHNLKLHIVLCQGQPTQLLCTVPRTHCTRDYCQCGLSIQKSEESHLKESFISHGRLSPVWSTKSEPGTVCPLIVDKYIL